MIIVETVIIIINQVTLKSPKAFRDGHANVISSVDFNYDGWSSDLWLVTIDTLFIHQRTVIDWVSENKFNIKLQFNC